MNGPGADHPLRIKLTRGARAHNERREFDVSSHISNPRMCGHTIGADSAAVVELCGREVTPLRVQQLGCERRTFVQAVIALAANAPLANQALANAITSGGARHLKQYARTSAEIAAGVIPANTSLANHTTLGLFVVDRYGANTTPGTTDMTTAINNAIAVAAAAEGGVVQFLSSTYKYSSTLKIPDFVELRGFGIGRTKIKPVGTFNAVTVHGLSPRSWANSRRVTNLEIDGSGGCIGNGLDIYAAGLRCYFADLYIHNMTGIGMRIMSSFDHVYERIECRSNTSFGIQTYEKQNFVDGPTAYEEQSFLRFIDVTAPANNFGVQLALSVVMGTYQIGEIVTQAISGATGIVSYFDIGSLNLYVRSVAGTFDTSHIVTGTTSTATGTPTTTSGASNNLTQWDVAGGDNFHFISVKPSEGLLGMDFSRSSFNHKISQLYFDSTLMGMGTAIRISKPGVGIVQYLDIDKVNCFQAATGIQCMGGVNIFIDTVMMNSGGNPVAALLGANGPIYLKTPRTAFTDENANQVIYPAENIESYTPVLSGGGAPVIGNGTLTGETYQHGNKVSIRIVLKIGSTTVMPTNGFGLNLPNSLAVKGGEQQLANAVAFQVSTGFHYNLTAILSTTTITFPLNGSAGFWSRTSPFPWAINDTLILAGEYEVN